MFSEDEQQREGDKPGDDADEVAQRETHEALVAGFAFDIGYSLFKG